MTKSFFDLFHTFRRITTRRCIEIEKRLRELETDLNNLEDKVSHLESLFTSSPHEIASDLFIASGEYGFSNIDEDEFR